MNFKKIIALALTVCLLAIVLAIPAFAANINETNPVDGVTWFRGEGYGLVSTDLLNPVVPIADIPVGTDYVDLTGYDVFIYNSIPLFSGELGLFTYDTYDASQLLQSYLITAWGDPVVGEAVPLSLMEISNNVIDGNVVDVTVSFDDNIYLISAYSGFGATNGTYGIANPSGDTTITFCIYNPDGVIEEEVGTTVIGSISTFINSAMFWVGSFVSSIVSNPIILVFCLCSFCGLGIGLFSRLKR